MSDAELNDYFSGQKSFFVRSSYNFIDYDDIEVPIKAVIKGESELAIMSPSVKNEVSISLKKHIFNDVTPRLQLFTDPTTHTYLNAQKSTGTVTSLREQDTYFF